MCLSSLGPMSPWPSASSSATAARRTAAPTSAVICRILHHEKHHQLVKYYFDSHSSLEKSHWLLFPMVLKEPEGQILDISLRQKLDYCVMIAWQTWEQQIKNRDPRKYLPIDGYKMPFWTSSSVIYEARLHREHCTRN